VRTKELKKKSSLFIQSGFGAYCLVEVWQIFPYSGPKSSEAATKQERGENQNILVK
jgi:hypothetical protein